MDKGGQVPVRQRLGAAVSALRNFWAEQRRLHERQQLRLRPWQEEFLHFALDGRLHGHFPPPEVGRRYSVTSDGWCPGWAGPARRHPTVAGRETP